MDVDTASPHELVQVTGGFPGQGLVAKLRAKLRSAFVAEPWVPPPGYKPLWQEALEAVGANHKDLSPRHRLMDP